MKRTARLGAFSFAAILLLGGASGSAQESMQPKIKASSIQILMVGSNEVDLPLPFQVALYENVIEQVQKTKKFEHVYRDGDHAAADAPDLIILHTNVFGFKRGSEEERQVTTVAGATQIKVHCQFTDKSGKSVLEQDVTGNVRFLGGNLRATYDFAKKVSDIVVKNFS
ncbi:MAG TPA: hypothetical protein VMH00_04765 [Candidatus Limnocylindrales bacterium]|nr:hypothetical protein [Candidatus Limnocylindrales bacterium]